MTLHPRPANDIPLRVLHISGRSDHGGGPEHILQVIDADMPGIQHFIACPQHGVYWQRYRQQLDDTHLCAIPHRSLSLSSFFRLRKFAKKMGIQIIHSHGTCAGISSRLVGLSLGLPVAHSFHGVPVTKSVKHHLYCLSEHLLGRMTDCAIAVSVGEADLAHRRWRHYRGKLAVVPNGISLSVTAPIWTPWPTYEPIRIVSFNRNNYQKNPELLIEIARILCLQGVNFRIDAYGEGLQHPQLLATAVRRGVSERLFFHPPTDTPAQALNGASIYLSTSRWEGMPLAVLEAWQAGLVVVASDVVGNRDLVKDGHSGLLFPCGNGRSAARLIRDLKDDPTRAETIRKQAAQHGKNDHSHSLMAMRLEWLYRNLVNPTDAPDTVVPNPARIGSIGTFRLESP